MSRGDQCQVKSLDLYVSKLHPVCSVYFHRPTENFSGKETLFVNCSVKKKNIG